MALVPHTYAASLTEHTFALGSTPFGLHLHFGLFSDSNVAGRFVEMVVEGECDCSDGGGVIVVMVEGECDCSDGGGVMVVMVEV